MKENLTALDSLDLLSERTMEQIDGIGRGNGGVRFMDPRNHLGFDIFNENEEERPPLA